MSRTSQAALLSWPGSASSRGRGTVLVADGAAPARDLLRLAVRTWGYLPYTACDGAEALELFRRLSPSIVLTELWLPKIDGIDLMRDMKSIDPNVWVVFVSSSGSIIDAKRAIREGAADFLTKPPDYFRLKSLVDEGIASAVAAVSSAVPRPGGKLSARAVLAGSTH